MLPCLLHQGTAAAHRAGQPPAPPGTGNAYKPGTGNGCRPETGNE